MNKFVGRIGRDEFGVNRIYVNIEDVPVDMLEELKNNMKFECADCGAEVGELVINMEGFISTEHSDDKREIGTSMYFGCGTCAIGG